MGLVLTYAMQGVQPSRMRDMAKRGAVALPWGGPTDVGGEFVQGSALTLVGGTAQAEILTLTVSGTGNYVLQFGSGERVYQASALAQNATAAQVCTALQTIWPLWVLPTGSVTGSAGGPYTVTFTPTARIGGKFSSVTSSGTAAVVVTRAQRGSCGAGQYDVADGVTFLACDAILIDQLPLGPTGDLSTIPYGPVSDTTFSPWAWIEGFFKASDVPNLTTAIVNASSNCSFYLGAAVATAGAEIRLRQ